VFITGGREELGHWRADGFPLARVRDCLWSGTVTLSDADPVEYKVTRGTWDTERLDKDGARAANLSIPAGAQGLIEIQADAWADHIAGGPPCITGDYRIHESVSSRYLSHDRRVIVWLPPSYATEKQRRYPVVYLHDGQQIFDPQTSTHGQDWEVDETCTRLIGEKQIEELIAVGIYSTEDREKEYAPFDSGEAYTSFVVEELKPLVDATYRTQPDCSVVAGASRGGTIAFYMAWTRPDIFSGVACLSPAFDIEGRREILDLIRDATTAPKPAIYLYCGKADDLEQALLPGMREMERHLLGHGWSQPDRRLQVVEDACGEHNEAAWARHTPEWLTFLFGTP